MTFWATTPFHQTALLFCSEGPDAHCKRGKRISLYFPHLFHWFDCCWQPWPRSLAPFLPAANATARNGSWRVAATRQVEVFSDLTHKPRHLDISSMGFMKTSWHLRSHHSWDPRYLLQSQVPFQPREFLLGWHSCILLGTNISATATHPLRTTE